MSQLPLLAVIRSIHIIAHQTDEIFDALLRREFGLTLSRFRILMPLIEIGTMTQAEIARFHFVTEASVARQIRLLKSDGYITRTADVVDARKFIIGLTPKTLALLPAVKKRLNTEIANVYAAVSTKEVRDLHVLLSKLQSIGSLHTRDGFAPDIS